MKTRILAFLFTAFLPAFARAADAKPNFLLIVADDLNSRDLGFTGNKDIHTPNIDKLRSDGIWLRNMYDPASTCSPTRHALYTGLDCIRSGAYPNHTRAYDGTKSMFTYFKGLGYRVGLQAKEHVGPKPTFPYEYISPNQDDFEAFGGFVNRDKSQPWLAVYASHDPHSPWDRGPKKLYDPAKLTVPPYLHDNEVTRKLLAAYYAEISSLDRQVGALLKILADSGQAENTLVMFVSEQGSSFPYGGKWSVYDNGIHSATVVRWPGKVKPGSTNDAMMEYLDVPPTFLAAVGEDPAKIDTGCPDATGYRGFDGKSFLEVLLGKSDHLRDVVFAQHTTVGIIGFKQPYPMRSARDVRYKYIRNLMPENTYEIGGIHKGQPLDSWKEDAKEDPALAKRIDWLYHRPGDELYDLEKDPLETDNLAANPDFAAIKQRLSDQMDAWMKQQGDKGIATEKNARSRQGKGDGGDE
ncbi:MAG: sulfatase [Luteolibacter sp.]|uniref:sulfatase family protein n=1 Tax=Luteolibacter sp. TaxID=1962973 RepID=UPI00326577F6